MTIIKVPANEYSVIKRDLRLAKKYMSMLEVEKQDLDARFKQTREALTLAAIVAYNRPFTACYRVIDNKKVKRPWIPARLAQSLPRDLKIIHDDLVEQRDTMWAHTDESHFDGRPLIKSYPKAVIPEFQRLIDEVLSRLEVSA